MSFPSSRIGTAVALLISIFVAAFLYFRPRLLEERRRCDSGASLHHPSDIGPESTTNSEVAHNNNSSRPTPETSVQEDVILEELPVTSRRIRRSTSRSTRRAQRIPDELKRTPPKKTNSAAKPKTGERLLHELLRPLHESLRREIENFIEEVHREYRDFSRRQVRKLRRGPLRRIWRRFVKREKPVLERFFSSESQGAFQTKYGTDNKIDNGKYPCRSSGAVESTLHIVAAKPPLTPGTYSHLSSPTLDSGNNSMASIILKGFRSLNCFVFDCFPRRVFIKYESRHNVRELFPEFVECYDDLHKEYRTHGGKITVIMGVMGDQAMSSYLTIVKQERLELQRLNRNEPCGYSVWLERSQEQPKHILRIVINITHPSYLRRKQKHVEDAIAMDNACNLAAELAGIGHHVQFDYYTTNRHHLSKQKKTLVKKRCRPYRRTNRTRIYPAVASVPVPDTSLSLAPAPTSAPVEVPGLDIAPPAPATDISQPAIPKIGSAYHDIVQSLRSIRVGLIFIWFVYFMIIYVFAKLLWAAFSAKCFSI